MRSPVFAILLLSGLIAPSLGAAQEYLALNSRQNRLVAPAERPHVSVAKRPDFYVRSAMLYCDTRNPERRRAELEATMRALLDAAGKNATIETAILRRSGEDSFAIPLEGFELFQRFIAKGPRPDSSVVRFLVKTPVGETDALSDVTGRLEAFRKAVPMTGRTELVFQGAEELSLINPRQYRKDVIQAIADDAKSVTEAMGEGYAVRVTGLERELAWRRSGDLELRLFLHHTLTLTPRQ